MPKYSIARVNREELQIPITFDDLNINGAVNMSAVEIVKPEEPEKDFATYLDDEYAAVEKAVKQFRKENGIEHKHVVSSFLSPEGLNILRIVFYHNPLN